MKNQKVNNNSNEKKEDDKLINAYPSFTKYDGINRTSPSFLMIDIDLKDFASKDKLDKAMNRILKKIESKMRGHPIVLWTDNGSNLTLYPFHFYKNHQME